MGRNKYNEEQKNFLRQFIPGHEEWEIINAFKEQFGIILNQSKIGNLKTKLGVRSGTFGGRYEKGRVPENKGKKWNEYMSLDGRINALKTCYKKGNINHNTTSVGTERTTKDGYITIKCNNPVKTYGNGWSKYYQLKHRIIWEQVNGPIPKGHKIIFADGNIRNFDINNLLLVKNSEHLLLNKNRLRNNNAELTKTGLSIVKVLDVLQKKTRS